MKRIVALMLIFILLLSASCSKPDDEENAVIDTSVNSEQTNENEQQAPEQNQEKTPVPETQQQQKPNTDNTDQKEEPKPESTETQQPKPDSTETEQQKQPTSDTQNEPTQPEKTPEEQKPEIIYDDSNATPASSFKYHIDKTENCVLIVKFIGTEKDVVIPNYIEGYPVKSISMYFCGADSTLESIVIPENIETIYDEAFKGCVSLKKIVTRSKKLSIGHRAFERCSSLNELVLGEGVIEVGAGAFRHCTSLRNIHIPSTLNTCGTGAFGGITIETLSFADGIETIGSSCCFYPAYGERTENSYKKLSIPASVKTLVTSSFGENLQEITFLGDAPEISGEEEILPKNVVVKYKKGTKGWDDPKWKAFKLVEIE